MKLADQKLEGGKPIVWIFLSVIGLALLMTKCSGANQDFPVKPTEGKARQHEALIRTNNDETGRCGPGEKRAGTTVVDDALLNQIAWKESRNNPRAVGRVGEIGEFQLRGCAIREVNRVYGTRYKLADAWDRVKAREIARLYLLICESRVRVKTPESVYATYRGKR